jgi:hypothetical protein
MVKQSFFIAFLMLFNFIACTQTGNKTEKAAEQKTETPTAPMVGGDSDEHGCKASAGYQWSALRGECIRIFETGIRLNAKAVNLDSTLSAFAVFKADEKDDAQAELFLPNVKQSVLLSKDKKSEAGKWSNADYVLTQWKGMYSLEDAKKVLLYQGAAVK